MRLLKLDENKIVIQIRNNAKTIYEGEFESDIGELNQKYEDGIFVNVELEESEKILSIEEELSLLKKEVENQSIVQLEVLATIFEELIMKG